MRSAYALAACDLKRQEHGRPADGDICGFVETRHSSKMTCFMGMKGVGMKYYTIVANLWYHEKRRGNFTGCGRSFILMTLIQLSYQIYSFDNNEMNM